MSGYIFDLPREYLKAAVLVSLLSAWVLVALFAYLNYYTRRWYFTIWSGAWVFYALWLTLSLSWHEGGSGPILLMFKQACAGLAAMGMIWGGCVFLQQPASGRLFGLFSVFLLLWSYAGAYWCEDPFWMQVPVFALMALGSGLMAYGFWRNLRQRHSMGASLLSIGFLLWAGYLACHPLWERSDPLISSGFFISAVLQLFISVSMIILVLEEVRITNFLALRQVEERTTEAEGLRSQILSTEERYRSLFSLASEAIIVTAACDLRILELNGAARQLLGISPDDGDAHSLKAYLWPRTSARTGWGMGQEWFTQVCRNHELEIVRSDGSTVCVEVAGAPVPYGGETAYQFFFREVTEKLHLERQLRQAEKLAALGRMISGVAHELNNPLAVVKGYLDLILSCHQLSKQTRANLEKVAHESDRAAKLVSNFLSFARKAPAQRGPVSINRLIENIVGLREMEFRIAGVETTLDLDGDLPETQADAGQLEQVMVNLLSNALHALEEWPSRRLLISTRRNGRAIIIRVEDSGPGIPLDVQPHIFEPFFTTKHVGSGTGLGLSIAFSILAEHNGRIYYEPSSEGGAGFVLELPVVEVEAKAQSGEWQGESETGCLADSFAAISQPSARRILIVDDEPALAELLAELLSTLGHLPTTCGSALEALELINQQPFDGILSDFRMPLMDGQQFYERLCQVQPALARRMVFVTGDLVSEKARTFLRAVGNPHLTKPFRLEAVGQALAEVLHREEGWASTEGPSESEEGGESQRAVLQPAAVS